MFVSDKRYFSNDRCASIDSAGAYECQVAEENWIYGHFDALPPNFDPLIEHLIADIKPDIRLSSIVTSIASKKEDKNISGDSFSKLHEVSYFDDVAKCIKKVLTKTVIVSVPLPVLKRRNIVFNPPLSKIKEKAIDQIDALPLILFTLRFKERPWPIDMAGAQIACGGHCVIPDITLMEATDEMCGTVCTATCFIGAEKALKMTTLTKEESIQVALSQLDEMFHDASQPQEKYPRASEVYVDSILEDWGKKPFVWCGYTSPSRNSLIRVDNIFKHSSRNKEARPQLLSARRILAQPHDTSVFFCGEATFEGCDVALQSAMSTGNRAASQAEEYLRATIHAYNDNQAVAKNEQAEQSANAEKGMLCSSFTSTYMSVGYINSIFPGCRGTPRQGYLMPSSKASLVLHKDVSKDVLIGLEEFEYVWVIFHFHKNKPIKLSKQEEANKVRREAKGLPPKRQKFKAKVRPPKIDTPNRRIGVFACRTPHRPNAIGLSVAKILSISLEDRTIFLSGLDLVDITPVSISSHMYRLMMRSHTPRFHRGYQSHCRIAINLLKYRKVFVPKLRIFWSQIRSASIISHSGPDLSDDHRNASTRHYFRANIC